MNFGMNAASIASPRRAFVPVGIGAFILAGCVAAVQLLSPAYAAGVIGFFISCFTCLVILVAMPRAAQLSFFGVAVGVTADGGYAVFTDQTPVTIATGLIRLANGLGKAVGLIAADAGAGPLTVIPIGVWTFIVTAALIMAASFLIDHDG